MRKLKKNASRDSILAEKVISDRELMLYTAAFLWSTTMTGIFIAGIVAPELAPPHVMYWRIVFTAIATVAIWSQLNWMQKLDDVRVYQLTIMWCIVADTMNFLLMLFNPLSIGAMFISMLAPAVFAANFLPKRWVIFQISLLTTYAIVPIIVHYDEVQSRHLVSRLAAFLPIMWAVAIAVYALKQDRVREIESSEKYADRDPLTGVGNLRALESRAEEIMGERNARISGQTALLLIDLDDFKSANTMHGHAGGDHVLRTVGNGLQRAASKTHLVARIGGDEFAVLIENADKRDVGNLAIRYRNAVVSARKELNLPGVTIDASIGTAIAGEDGSTLEELMTAADRAMYAIKDRHTADSEANRRAELKSQLPNEFQTPTSTVQWMSETVVEEEPEPEFSLRWSQRPTYAKFAAAAWALAVSLGLFSLMMPDADMTHKNLVVIGCLLGYGVAAYAYVFAPEIGSWRHLTNDVFTLIVIAVSSALTGGVQSPLWPLVFLFIVYEAWFLDARQIWFRLIGPIVVICLPLAYQSPAEIGVPGGAAIYSGVLVGIGITIAMSYNQYFLKMARDKTRLLATVDPRTGLANRREFEREVQSQLDRLTYTSSDALAIVMLDLDNFKEVNTTHGHKAGDELLKNIATALGACARENDCVARVGGDEFAVVIPGVDAQVAQTLARRFVDAVSECTASSNLLACREVSASAGFALYGLHGRTMDELINAADMALMSVKTSGKGVERVSSFVVSL